MHVHCDSGGVGSFGDYYYRSGGDQVIDNAAYYMNQFCRNSDSFPAVDPNLSIAVNLLNDYFPMNTFSIASLAWS